MNWAQILAYITGTVDHELLLRNEYLAAENQILKPQFKTRLSLTDLERVILAEIAHSLCCKVFEDVANAAKPNTILQRHGIPLAPNGKRTKTWTDFIRTQMFALAGSEFFTLEVLTLRWLVTYYLLLFIHLQSRRVEVSGITPHPNKRWMKQIARNVTTDECSFLDNCSHLIHDRDTRSCQSFRKFIESRYVKTPAFAARAPSLNVIAERWVKSVKEDCLSKLILFGEASLRRVLREYRVDYHAGRNHQAKDNVLLFPVTPEMNRVDGSVGYKERLGGLLKYYHREAA